MATMNGMQTINESIANVDRSWLQNPSARRVMQAINFECPDRLPRWDNFGLGDGFGLEFVRK